MCSSIHLNLSALLQQTLVPSRFIFGILLMLSCNLPDNLSGNTKPTPLGYSFCNRLRPKGADRVSSAIVVLLTAPVVLTCSHWLQHLLHQHRFELLRSVYQLVILLLLGTGGNLAGKISCNLPTPHTSP